MEKSSSVSDQKSAFCCEDALRLEMAVNLKCMSSHHCLRSYGIFRVFDPCGMSVLKECQENGFHLYKELVDGSPIY